MTQRVVVHGDRVETPLILADGATVEVKGGIQLTGTGHATINSKQICLGKYVSGQKYPFTYTKGAYTIDGEGTLKVEAVLADHVGSAGAVMVSAGKVMIAFTTSKAAKTPPKPESTPDFTPPSKSYEFDLIMSNDFVSTSDQ